MSEKTEVLLAKLIVAIIIILAVIQACEAADKIAELLASTKVLAGFDEKESKTNALATMWNTLTLRLTFTLKTRTAPNFG